MTMSLTFKSYRRRDGSWMLYINNDRSVSLGISPEMGFGPSTKLTAGQVKLRDAAKAAFMRHASPFTGDVAAHNGPKVDCGPYTMLITDIAAVGGMDVGMDGAYVVRDGLILRCGAWYAID